MIVLRPDQTEIVRGVYNAWGLGAKNVLIVQPTGGGKSVIEGSIARDIDATGANHCIIAHRQELVGQMSLHLARADVRHRIIAPHKVVAFITAEHRRELGRSFIDPAGRAAVAGVDTLVRRVDVLKQWALQVAYWSIDEAHHVLVDNKWGAAAAMFPNARGIGLTATPKRADGQGLGRSSDGVFDQIVLGPTMRELIALGALTDYEIVVPLSDFNPDLLKLGGSGDFTPASMTAASKSSHIVGDVVAHYQRYAAGKRCVVFATDVATANEMAVSFNAAGIRAVAISADTDDDIRSDMVRRFRNGEIDVLCNVDIFGEGFDLPAIECVIMARPTASTAVYMQQFGRALRPLPGKRYGLIIDCVSNVKRHGLPDKARFWTLDRYERRSKPSPDDVPVKICRNVPDCGRAYDGLLRACPYCEFQPIPVGGGRSIEQVDGDLMLLDAATLQRMRDAITLEDPGAIMQRIGDATGSGLAAAGQKNRQIERVESQRRLWNAIAYWAGRERPKGFSDPALQRRFYHGTGNVDILSALALPRVDMDKISDLVEGW